MTKIVTIVGARPQFVKAAVVSREIAARSGIEEILVHTGQHFDRNMSDVFFEEMRIPRPHHSLGVHSLGHGAMTGRMLEGIEELLLREKPDFTLVYGDTNSTLAGALAARKLHIRCVHVEAGLRSFNLRMPEEINRILTDRISDLLCCPTQQAVLNLRGEGFESFPCRVVNTGDVMQDAARYYSPLARKPAIELPEDFSLATLHRAENTDDASRLLGILSTFEEAARHRPVVLPLHPRTRARMADLSIPLPKDVYVLDPVGYLEMVWLLERCALVMTDSGGLQKEAYFFGKPCITLRGETEWVELVTHGVNRLASTLSEVMGAYRHFNDPATRPDFTADLYGGGKAAARILDAVEALAREAT